MMKEIQAVGERLYAGQRALAIGLALVLVMLAALTTAGCGGAASNELGNIPGPWAFKVIPHWEIDRQLTGEFKVVVDVPDDTDHTVYEPIIGQPGDSGSPVQWYQVRPGTHRVTGRLYAVATDGTETLLMTDPQAMYMDGEGHNRNQTVTLRLTARAQ